MVYLSIIVPTCGRPTLDRTLRSILAAGIRDVDEVIVIGDGFQEAALRTVAAVGHHGISYCDVPKTAFMMGNPQRREGMKLAKGTHLLFIDDDDAYRPGVLPLIAGVAEKHPGRILIFKMQSQTPRRTYGTLWKFREVFLGNIGTPMMVIPNVQKHLGEWGTKSAGDYDFLKSTLTKWPGGKASIVWREEVIVDVY